MSTPAPPQRPTDVKVFISSTFSDLDRERDYIQQVVFNSLRRAYKDLSINEIDLRWGITEEEANNGRVLDLCLQYIHESRPFFIGILGDRYGTSFPSDQVALTPLVEEHFPHAKDDIRSSLSATEIEMLNGVLRNPDARAMFFIKKDARPFPGETKEQWSRLERLKMRIYSSQRKYKVVEYTRLEDFDAIKDFIKEHIGPPEQYAIPADGMERADRISRLHYERSLSYIREVPYDHRLDKLLATIDATISQSKLQCAFIGLPGVGKSTTLAYMAHHFTGERIYVPIYGDIDDLPSTHDEIITFLTNALKNAIFKNRQRRSKWHQFKEWFRDGYNEINYDDLNQLYPELLRHKWCFVLDNYESSEWLPYEGFGRTSFSKARQVYDKIRFLFSSISTKYKKKSEIITMYVRDMDRSTFDRRVTWNNTEPLFDLNKYWWFNAAAYVPALMATHLKRLLPHQLEALVSAPMRMCPGAVRLTCQYMIEFVDYDGIDNFAERVHSVDQIAFPYRLYIEQICTRFGKPTAERAMILLMIYRSGISMQEFEAQIGLGHVDFLFLLRLLSPFVVYTGKGIRLADHMLESRIQGLLGITDEMIRQRALPLAEKYHEQLLKQINGFLPFKGLAKSSFQLVAERFDFLLPGSHRQWIKKTTQLYNEYIQKYPQYKSQYIQELNQKIMELRVKYWIEGGRLNDGMIYHAYNNEDNEWMMSAHDMRNYLMTAYAARNTKYLIDTVHNPHFIRYLWDYPLYLLVWDTYLKNGGEFAAPFKMEFPRVSYDTKAIMRILDLLMHTSYETVIKPWHARIKPGEKMNIDHEYLKNYPK